MSPLAPSPRSQLAGSCAAVAHQHLTEPAKGCGEYVFGVFSREVRFHASSLFRSSKEVFTNASEFFADLRKGAE